MYRKDKNPNETIKHIKDILKKNGINVRIRKIEKTRKYFYSARLEFYNGKGIGVNGKGITKKLAIASAYAEFMERLQSRMLIDSTYLLKTSNCFYKDKLTKTEFLKRYGDYYNAFFLKESEEYREKFWKFALNEHNRYVTKFTNVIDNKEKELPISLINYFTHTNGLCAGNTYEEAIVQGMCEVLERFVYKQIVTNNINLPNILQEDIENLEIYAAIKKLEKLGYKCVVKDCTMGGKYPVVGLTLLDKERKKYLFTIASDPDLNIAIQRCLTEMMQGRNLKSIYSKMKTINMIYEYDNNKYNKEIIEVNWIKNYTYNDGVHFSNVLENTENKRVNELPFKKVNNNQEALKYMINLMEKEDIDVWIKSYSKEDFITYKVYIPSKSEIEYPVECEYRLFLLKDKLKEVFLNFNYSNIVFEDHDFETIYSISIMKKYSDILSPAKLYNKNNFVYTWMNNIDFKMLLIYCLLKQEKYDELLVYLDKYINSTYLFKTQMEYYKYLQEFVYLKKNNELTNIIVKKDNALKKDAFDLVNNINEYILNKEVTTCPNCKICKSKRKCMFKFWEYNIKKINGMSI